MCFYDLMIFKVPAAFGSLLIFKYHAAHTEARKLFACTINTHWVSIAIVYINQERHLNRIVDTFYDLKIFHHVYETVVRQAEIHVCNSCAGYKDKFIACRFYDLCEQCRRGAWGDDQTILFQ